MVQKPREVDPQDGLPIPYVNPWAADKHAKLKMYCEVTRAVRRQWSFGGKYNQGSSYIDLFCSYGQCMIQSDNAVLPGSPMVAALAAREKKSPFDSIFIADNDRNAVGACKKRMESAGFPVEAFVGKAEDTVKKVCSRLSPHGFHFAFLDPYNIGALPFSVIESLFQLQRMDMLIHVSVSDINRNFDRYSRTDMETNLDRFVPGWRDEIGESEGLTRDRVKVLNFWRKLLEENRYLVPEQFHIVTGERGQPLYALALAGRHPLSQKLWRAVLTATSPQKELF